MSTEDNTVRGTVSTSLGDVELKQNAAVEQAANSILLHAIGCAARLGLDASELLDVLTNALAIYFVIAAEEDHYETVLAKLLEGLPRVIEGHRQLRRMQDTKGRA